MTRTESNEREWLSWIEVQKKAFKILVEQEDPEAAMAIVERYLESRPPMDLEGEALSFRGYLREVLGDQAGAHEDLLSAHELSQEGSFGRYTVEVALGAMAEKVGRTDESVQWYWRALDTASQDPTTSSGGALRRLLMLRPEGELSQSERQVLLQEVRRSWALLRLEGEPGHHDLKAAAEELVRAEGRPRSQSDS